MKRKTKIDGVEIILDDKNSETSGITELDGDFAEQAESQREDMMIKELERRGYKVIK